MSQESNLVLDILQKQSETFSTKKSTCTKPSSAESEPLTKKQGQARPAPDSDFQ